MKLYCGFVLANILLEHRKHAAGAARRVIDSAGGSWLQILSSPVDAGQPGDHFHLLEVFHSNASYARLGGGRRIPRWSD
jgi:hypothetical protein